MHLLVYRNTVNDDFLRIGYGEIPNALVGEETNGSALAELAASAAHFTPDEKGVTAADGKLAGWAQKYLVTIDSYQTEIVFMTNNTYIEAYALCRSIRLNEVRDLIYSLR